MKYGMCTRALALGGIALAAMLGIVATQPMVKAQDEDHSGIVVGSYNPQQVGEQMGLQSQLEEFIGGLQERIVSAQEANDQQAMQQLEMEYMSFRENLIDEFESNMAKAMEVAAEEAGVKMIAIEIAWTAPGITTKDVTQNIITAMGGEVAAAAPPAVILPLE